MSLSRPKSELGVPQTSSQHHCGLKRDLRVTELRRQGREVEAQSTFMSVPLRATLQLDGDPRAVRGVTVMIDCLQAAPTGASSAGRCSARMSIPSHRNQLELWDLAIAMNA